MKLNWSICSGSGRIEVRNERGVLHGWIGCLHYPYIVQGNTKVANFTGTVLSPHYDIDHGRPRKYVVSREAEAAILDNAELIPLYLLACANHKHKRQALLTWLEAVYNHSLWSKLR